MTKLSIFENNAPEQDKDVFVNGISNEIKEIVQLFGGTTKTSEKLCWKISKIKDITTRKPISIKDTKTLVELIGKGKCESIKTKIASKELIISCRKSPIKVKFPKNLTPDFAYITGIILGDGSMACNKSNINGNWRVCVFFDNKEHQAHYDKIFETIFGIQQKHRQTKPNCFESYVNSKAIHWILRGFFEMSNGFKANKIKTPTKIKNSTSQIKAAFMQGLFDSDGTITKRGEIKFSTTSEQMIKEVKIMLLDFGMAVNCNTWIKAEKYLPLHTVALSSRINRKIFAEKIGFRHPIKKVALANFTNSPIV